MCVGYSPIYIGQGNQRTSVHGVFAELEVLKAVEIHCGLAMTDPEGKTLGWPFPRIAAMQELNARFGTVSHDEYKRLRELSEQSPIACLVTEHAFEKYIGSKN
jgi:hypothetical protein